MKKDALHQSGRIEERLKELLLYHPERGEFSWKEYRSPSCRKGDIAGTDHPCGYRRLIITVDGRRFGLYIHRVVWLFENGYWPEFYIDHIDGDRSNNVISNLREADFNQNLQNISKRAGCTSKFLGVCRTRYGRWTATINVKGKYIHIGSFSSEEEAFMAYLRKKKEVHDFMPENVDRMINNS